MGVEILGVNEWLVSVVQSMYKGTTTVVRVNGRDSKAFGVRIGIHKGSVLTFQHSARSFVKRECWEGLPMEPLYADDLVLMS